MKRVAAECVYGCDRILCCVRRCEATRLFAALRKTFRLFVACSDGSCSLMYVVCTAWTQSHKTHATSPTIFPPTHCALDDAVCVYDSAALTIPACVYDSTHCTLFVRGVVLFPVGTRSPAVFLRSQWAPCTSPYIVCKHPRATNSSMLCGYVSGNVCMVWRLKRAPGCVVLSPLVHACI